MAAIQLLLPQDARGRIRRSIDALSDAVNVILGPRGRTVLLDREYGPPQIVNSGVVVARAIELEDRFENMGAQLLREVAARTSEMAGDGTTTATVLAHGMIREGLKHLAAGMNPLDLKRGIDAVVEAVVGELKQLAQPCETSQPIAHVAALSALTDLACRIARDEGVLVSIASDANGVLEFGHLVHGVATARRGWLRAADVLNTRSLDDLRPLLAATMGRAAAASGPPAPQAAPAHA